MRCALPRLGYWERKKGLMKVARTERPAGIKSVHSLALITLLFALCVSAQAQQPKKVPRVGFLTLLTHPDPREEEFVQGLRELGHIDGQNITIEYRRSAGEVVHLATLAKELVRLKVDLIVARSTPAIEAAKNVTTTIPIVMLGAADPVRSGFVVSLARPGGNITGNSNINPELAGKRLELLREIVL